MASGSWSDIVTRSQQCSHIVLLCWRSSSATSDHELGITRHWVKGCGPMFGSDGCFWEALPLLGNRGPLKYPLWC